MVNVEPAVLVAVLNHDLPLALVWARLLALGADDLGVGPVDDLTAFSA